MSDASEPLPGSARGSGLVLAQIGSGLEPLQPILRAWAWKASERTHEAQAWAWAYKPWGIGVLHDIAWELGWQTEHSRTIGRCHAPDQPWPVGWQRSVEFSLSPPGSSTRWAFAVRRLFVPPGSAIDDEACAAALRSAQRALRRLPRDPHDIGIAAIELRIPIPVGDGDEAADLARAIEQLHHIRQSLGADGLLVNAAPPTLPDDAYANRMMASLLTIC